MMQRTLTFLSAGLLFGGIVPARLRSGRKRRNEGATVYRQRCAARHGPNAAGRPNLGPSLVGVLGRRAAATPFNYSAALKRSRLTWNRANLDRYLAAPQRMVPGTRMIVALPDAAQRQAVINHLSVRR